MSRVAILKFRSLDSSAFLPQLPILPRVDSKVFTRTSAHRTQPHYSALCSSCFSLTSRQHTTSCSHLRSIAPAVSPPGHSQRASWLTPSVHSSFSSDVMALERPSWAARTNHLLSPSLAEYFFTAPTTADMVNCHWQDFLVLARLLFSS